MAFSRNACLGFKFPKTSLGLALLQELFKETMPLSRAFHCTLQLCCISEGFERNAMHFMHFLGDTAVRKLESFK